MTLEISEWEDFILNQNRLLNKADCGECLSWKMLESRARPVVTASPALDFWLHTGEQQDILREERRLNFTLHSK